MCAFGYTMSSSMKQGTFQCTFYCDCRHKKNHLSLSSGRQEFAVVYFLFVRRKWFDEKKKKRFFYEASYPTTNWITNGDWIRCNYRRSCNKPISVSVALIELAGQDN